VRHHLRSDGGRLVLVGFALVAIGLVGLLGSLLDARETFVERGFGGLERVVLILVFSAPAAGVPFVLGVLLLTLARRRGAPLHPQAVPSVWGAVIAVAILGAAMALGGLAAALMGTFGDGGDQLDLGAWRRVRALVESGVGGLALSVGVLAAGRAFTADRDDAVAAPRPTGDAELGAPAVPPLVGTAGVAPSGGPTVPPVSAVPPGQPTHAGNGAGAPPAIDPALARWGATVPAEPVPPPPSPLDQRRRAFADALRFSPRADDARILLDRLERNPADVEAAAAFDALLGHGGR
jgi:hypothetical protein